MKKKMEELRMTWLKLDYDCIEFMREYFRTGVTPLPYEVRGIVSSERTGYEPRRVAIVAVDKLESGEYPYFVFTDSDGYEYIHEDLSFEAKWNVMVAYVSSTL